MPFLLVFFKSFLQNPRQVSSVIPTSPRISQRLAARVRPGRSVIVEYGPGIGGLTRALLKSGKLSMDSKIILIEKNDILFSYLKQNFSDPRVHVFHDSAEHVERILKECGEQEADYIFTSIPFVLMNNAFVDSILQATKRALASSGRLVVFLVHEKNRSALDRHFTVLSQTHERCNIPPLIVFEAMQKTACPEKQAV